MDLRFPRFRFTIYALLVFSLTGCIDLSGTSISHRIKASVYESSRPNMGEVHTMRGGLGIFSIGMNQLRDKIASQYHIPSYSSMWYDAGHVSQTLISRYYRRTYHQPIILIGHSLGANEQIKVAENLGKMGIPVDLLITVDAVLPPKVSPNVLHVFNVYKPGFVPMFSGLKLYAVNPKKTQIENLNVDTLKGIHVNHFTIDKDKVVQGLIMDRVKRVLGNEKRKYS